MFKIIPLVFWTLGLFSVVLEVMVLKNLDFLFAKDPKLFAFFFWKHTNFKNVEVFQHIDNFGGKSISNISF